MDTLSMVRGLQEEATKDSAFRDVCHVFAQRERARSQVTIASLSQTMVEEGFKYNRDDYGRVLRKLGGLGVGSLEKNKKGRVIALKDIKVTLQSIGAAALKQKEKLENFKMRNNYRTLTAVAEMIKPKENPLAGPGGFPVSITVVINGKPVNFRVPKELNETEIADLVVRFRDKGEN
jgi:hypothetical protein